ncbi:DNA adenine methylase [Candidatus Phytoplasma ziziphi]|nr:Dam family site-specific DNA-(adenine-N6)-methyltransferase [Candidatus Phytoplasma ziziphi]
MQKFINWVGCKKKLLPHLLPLIPKKFKTYYEPFLGSGALYLSLMPKKAILNDNDTQLIQIWKSILYNPQDFYNKALAFENFIYQYPKSQQKQQKTAFENLLKQYNHLLTKNKNRSTKASLFFILSKYCFRGILRYKDNTSLYTTFGYKSKYKTSLLNLNDLFFLQKHFQKNKHLLLCTDYQKIIANAKKDDFVFIDPPYYNGKNITISSFYKGVFGFTEQVKLFNCLEKADKSGAKWLYTNYDTPEIRALFKNYYFQSIKSSTSHNLTNKNNNHEIIITNY